MAAVPFRVKALYDYSSGHDDDLPFGVGQIITVTAEEDDDWYSGEYVDDAGTKQEGIFPRNFVEKFEPSAPPRPTRRAKKEPEPEPEAEPAAAGQSRDAAPLSPRSETAPRQSEPEPAPEVKLDPPKPAPPPVQSPPPSAPVPQPAKAPETVGKGTGAETKAGPPPVAAKSSSIRDRIAAFNKPGGAPITPFKPGGPGYVKKPFVPPPPSRDSYMPPPRAEVPKTYIREEDPEVKEIESENRESAEKAGIASSGAQEGEEDQPKPMTLQERMALLQRQQAEAAQRHADAAAKKEKAKRPPKKRTESSEPSDVGAEPDAPRTSREHRDSESTDGKRSVDEPRQPPPPRRKSSKGPTPHVDGNEADMSGAGDTTEGQESLTEREDSDDKSRRASRPPPVSAGTDDLDEEDTEEDEEDVDPEVRRKEELRARVAKMSGGMGMPGMFMPMPGPSMPKKKKSAPPKEPTREAEEYAEETSPTGRAAPPVPTMMALPGMPPSRRSGEATRSEEHEPEPTPKVTSPILPARPLAEGSDDEDYDRQSTPPHIPAGPPPVPGGRPAPPPVPSESRPAPPPRPADAPLESAGSESDDELSERPGAKSETPKVESAPTTRPPPPLPPVASPTSPSMPRPPPIPAPASEGTEMTPASPTSPAPQPPSKRSSRPPPPIPGAAPPPLPAQTRPPPPPPPGTLSRESTANEFGSIPTRSAASQPRDEDEEEEVTEYEGDYDTDIASSVPHKDALKATGRESSFEETTHVRSPTSPTSDAPPSAPPPIPGSAAPRAIPPPIPSQAPPPPAAADKRRSVDAPRAAPPPPPTPAKEVDDYDPYSYVTPQPSSSYQHSTPKIEEEAYFADTSRGPPSGPPPTRPMPRQSLDVQRGANRRSADVGRPSLDTGFIADDVDLAVQSGWWKQSNQVPPVLQGRKDVYYESEESTSTNRGSKTIVTRTVYVLFIDYSQTVLTIRYDPYDSSDVDIEQRHEPPPRHLRQDQLEQSYDRFGRRMADAVALKKDSVVGDGTPQGLIFDLLRPFRDALHPVGTRAYGALVYANMANASTQQTDEIRPGDIMTVRNARFQGKHGAMHAKYTAEVGKPDHVAVVAEWDGTKKKLRAWEQGRESRKVKMESFKLDDLRSGEVKIWRVMPRSWVGWNTQP